MLISPYRWHAMRWTLVLFAEMTIQTLTLAYTSYSHQWITRITYVLYVTCPSSLHLLSLIYLVPLFAATFAAFIYTYIP